MVADEKARVAVSSRGFASAAAEGLRTLPARDTATTDGVVGAVATAIAVTAGAVVSATNVAGVAAVGEAGSSGMADADDK